MEGSVRMESVSQGRSWLAGLFLFTICLFAFENSLALAVLDLTVDQAGFELSDLCLSLHPQCWD